MSSEKVIFLSDIVAPAAISAVDIDGDSDIDVIAALEDELFWYENIGGEEIFSSIQVIDTLPANLKSLNATDLNGDGFTDILAAYDSLIIWMENSGSNGIFYAPITIGTLSNDLQYIYSCDLDGDGDIDLLSATRDSNELTWFENSDGKATFTVKQLITTMADFVQSIYTADIDGDRDKDILTASAFDDKIAWYENTDGLGTFGEQRVISTLADYARSVYTADIDGDGDLDVLSASSADDKIAWYENTDGQGTFSEQMVIATTADYPQYVYAADLDGDGDMDAFSASFFDDKVAWYENTDGAGTFASEQVISTQADQAGFVYAGDLDNDGDKDVITASCDFKIAWHENSLPLQILSNPSSRFVPLNESITLGVSVNEYVTNYQWQVNMGEGFTDLLNSEVYSGVNEDSLQITGFTSEMSGNEYQCITSDSENSLISEIAVLIEAPEDELLIADDDCMAILPNYTKDLDYIQIPLPYEKISGVTTVTLQGKDTVNAQIYTFTVEVIDNAPPYFVTLPNDQTVEVDSDGEAFIPNVINNVVVEDHCSYSQDIEIVQSPAAYTLITDTTEVTITATDLSGNSVDTVIMVNLADNLPPSIICQDNQSVDIEEGEGMYTVIGNQFDPIAVYDNFSINSIVNSFNDSSSLEDALIPVGVTNVVWTVTDVWGNTAQCDYDITVIELTEVEQLKTEGIFIFPNPSEGIIYYKTSGTIITSMKIIDLTGRVLIERTDIDSQGMIDLTTFKNGLLHCVIATPRKQYIVKLVLQE